MTATLAFGRPGAVAGRAALVPLAAREARRFVLNPVFLFAVVMTAWTTWTGGGGATTEIDSVNGYPAVFLGGFGMMAAYWLTRSMRASEPVAGVTPTTQPTRTAALCWVAIVPFCCGRRGVRGPDPNRGTGRGGRHRRCAGADGARPRAAGRALGPHVPGARRRRPVLGPRVVDHPRGVRSGHRRLSRWPKPATPDAPASVIRSGPPGPFGLIWVRSD